MSDTNEYESDEEFDDHDLTLTEYDKRRRPVPLIKGKSIVLNTELLSTELTCPICFDLLTKTMVTMDCLHRFCNDCIIQAMNTNKECPTCRAKLISKRNLRHDKNMDDLIRRLFPDRKKYDAMCTAASGSIEDRPTVASFALTRKATATPRKTSKSSNQSTNDHMSPVGSGHSTATEPFVESGRQTPPWIRAGDICQKKLKSNAQKQQLMAAHKLYLQAKSDRLHSVLGDRKPAVDKHASSVGMPTETSASSPVEPAAKTRKLDSGEAERATSCDSSEASTVEGEHVIRAEVDNDEIEELAMLEPATFGIDTVQRCAPSGPSFDPLANEHPPFPSSITHPKKDLVPESVMSRFGEEENDEEAYYVDDSDSMSDVTLDDLAYELDDHHDPFEGENPDEIFANLDRKIAQDKCKYADEETRFHLRKLNELRLGNLADINGIMADLVSSKGEVQYRDTTVWYSQRRGAEELLYYEQGEQAVTKARPLPTTVYNREAELERMGRRITLKEIMDDMSDTSSESDSPHSFSLASSADSSALTVSALHDDQEDEIVKRNLPLPGVEPKEKVHSWLDGFPEDPCSPESKLSIGHADDGGNEDDIEVELVAAASFLEAHPAVAERRFIRAHQDTTMEHLAQFLRKRWAEAAAAAAAEEEQYDQDTPPPAPRHFYTVDSEGRPSHLCKGDSLNAANNQITDNGHLVIYYGNKRATSSMIASPPA